MGYKTYKEYLLSPLWESIKDRVYKNRDYKCVLCSEEAQCVHHRGYGRAVLAGEELHQLVTLCNKCHQAVEFTKGGFKRSLVESQASFDALLKKKRKSLGAKVAEKMVGKLGYCNKCGKKAIKQKLYCKDHRPKEERKICPQCKIRPQGNHGIWCYPCLWRNVDRWSGGRARRGRRY